MKKLGLMIVGAIGFVLGSRAGRKPYDALEQKVRQLAGRPSVRAAKDAAQDKVAIAASAASDKVRDAGATLHEKIASN